MRKAAVLLTIFLIMFALNHLMPLHRDDFDYSMIWQTGVHVNSISDAIQSTWLHYLEHGGRLITVFCLNLFLYLGKLPFDIANALMFVALIVLIEIHATRRINFDPKLLAVTGLLAWLSLPHFGEVAIWKSGSTVYLWSAVPAALFLLPYNLNIKSPTLIMFPLGIIAGCSVENLGVTVTLIAMFQTYRKFEKWKLSGALGSLLGLLILLGAPGNFVRYDAQGSGKGVLQHIGNLIAGNAEMLLYILPIILLIVCALKILSGDYKIKKRGGLILPTLTAIFIFSYFADSLLTTALKDFCESTLFPLINPTEKFITRFENTLSKSEEFIIYLLIILMIYRRLGVTGKIHLPPQINYGLMMFALALFNNFVMVAAPTFPARATFSSVVMILIGAISIFNQVKIPIESAKILKLGAVLIGGFTIISALMITYQLRQENDARLAIIERAEKKTCFAEHAIFS